MKIKKLYRVQFAKQDLNTEGVFLITHTRFFDVVALEAPQAVRKVRYLLTRKKLSFPAEFIDAVTRISLIDIK